MYDWHRYDNVVREARAKGLNVLGIIAYTPSWAREHKSSSNKFAPNPTKFSEFAAKVASRYAPMGVHCWEIWNEPNLRQFWLPRPNARDYADLLRLTYASIKKVDSSATVIAGALSNCGSDGINISPNVFVRRMYESNGQGYFDALSIHPYTSPFLPDYSGFQRSWAELSALHRIMVLHHDGHKRIWITEYGAPTNGPGVCAASGTSIRDGTADHVTEKLQAAIVSNAVSLYLRYSWAGPFFWYSFQDAGVSRTDTEDFYGLMRFDGSKKPAYYRFKNLISGVK